MNPATFQEFQASAREQGYDEALVREWAPGQVLDTHTHPFSVKALVVNGSLVLTHGGVQRSLQAGDWFELPREAPHAEHYGAAGATFWVARRHAL